MSHANVLQQDREQLQRLRSTLDRRRSVSTSIRAVAAALRDRRDRLERGAERRRTDDAVLDTLSELLAIHEDGMPVLAFLQRELSTLAGRLEDDYGERYRALKLPWQSHSEVFPVVLSAYASGDGTVSRSDVRDSVRAILSSDAAPRVAALAWFFTDQLHPIADDAVEETRDDLRAAREDHVAHLEVTDDPDVTDPLQALGAEAPIAALPVRVETRFEGARPDGGELKVRVYPEQIHVDSHEEPLTEAEYDWGTEFWAQVWFLYHDLPDNPEHTTAGTIHGGVAAGSDAEGDRLPSDRLRGVVEDLFSQVADGAFSADAAERFAEVRDRAWQRGVERFGTERAAYVVHALSPVDGLTDVGERLLEGPTAGHWERPVREFTDLRVDDQVRAFVEFDVPERRYVLSELIGADAVDDLDYQEVTEALGEELSAVDERRRVELLEELRAEGRIGPREREWLDDLFEAASPHREPPPLAFPDVDSRPESWTRAPRARLLPDRWIVYASWEHPRGTPDLSDLRWSTEWRSVDGESSAWRRWDPDCEHWVKKVTGPAIREPLAVGPSPEAVAGKDEPGEARMEWMIDYDAAEAAGMALRVANPSDGTWDADEGYETLVATGVRTSGDPDRTAEELRRLFDAQQYTAGLSFLEQGTPTNNADRPSSHNTRDDPAAAAPAKVGPPLVPVDDGQLEAEGYVPLDGGSFMSDGARVADALGISTDAFTHVAGADTLRDVDAGHVNDALWPATWGYYARHLLVPEALDGPLGGDGTYGFVGDTDWYGPENHPDRLANGWLAKYRTHFREHVRAGGPLQTLRVGPQPYGILPATPLDVDVPATLTEPENPAIPASREGGLWSLDPGAIDEGRFLAHLIERVSTLRPLWLASADSVGEIGTGALDDQGLLNLLARQANPATLRRRAWLFDDANAVWRLFDDDEYAGALVGSRDRDAGVDEDAVRDQNLDHVPELPFPRIGSMRFLGQTGVLADEDQIVDDALPTFARALGGILDDSLYDPLPQPSNSQLREPRAWLDRLRALGGDWRFRREPETTLRSPQGWLPFRWDTLLRSNRLVDEHDWLGGAPITTELSTTPSVLRNLLHFATLRELAAARARLGSLYRDPLDVDPDPPLYDGTDTIFERLLDELPGDEGPLRDAAGGGTLSGQPPTYAHAIQAAIRLDGSPEIDLFSRRFARSLDHVAAMGPEAVEDRSLGTLGLAGHRLDAWWTSIAMRQLWNLRRDGTSPTVGPATSGVLVGAFGYAEALAPEPDETGEYLLAPSQNQVTTAAILRSAHRAADDDAHQEALAVDLSAERVRRARRLMSGVRDGIPLSTLLGHRFERRLREATRAPGEPHLQQYIDAFRTVAPARPGRADRKVVEDEVRGHSKRSDIVDGHEFYRTWNDGELWDAAPIAGLDSSEREAVEAILEEFDRTFDAVNDVLTAEAVHQLSQGNPDRATAALEGLSRGKQLPEPEILRTPRRETGVNNRLAVLFGDAEWRDESSSEPLDSRYALRSWEQDRQDLIDPDADLPGSSSGSRSDGDEQETVGLRHVGEPNLAGWVGELLPQPDRVRCTASYRWTEQRDFATGSFETPTEPGVVSVADVGFEPDVLLFRVSHAVERANRRPSESAPVRGWTHGTFHDPEDGAVSQHSTSLAVAADGAVTEYASADDRALAVATSGDGPSPAIAATVDATYEDGFDVRFEGTLDESLVVQYRALACEAGAVRVGQFTTADVADAPATQAIDLDAGEPIVDDGDGDDGNDELSSFDPDHLLLTASNAIEAAGGAGSIGADAEPGPLTGFSLGEAVLTDDGIDQQAFATAFDPTTEDGTGNAAAFEGDAALSLLYGAGNAVDEVTTARVTDLGRDEDGRARLELEYQELDDGASFGGHSQLVTYVAFESPTTEDPVPATHRPAIGYATAPDAEGGAVAFDPGFEPGCVEVTACPSISTPPGTRDGDGQAPLSVRRMGADTAGWSAGVATGVTDQRVLSEAVRTVKADDGSASVDATTGLGSGSDIVSVTYLDDEGVIAGRDVGRVARMDGDGVAIEFPELHSAGEAERPLIAYRAWPKQPEDRPYAVKTTVTLDELDLSPLDAVSLSQVDARPGSSQLERRLQYYAFRHRPDHRPPIPDDADLELTFEGVGADERSHVSFAQYLEHARSIRDFLGDVRPADAADFAHPTEASRPGYLPADSPDESGSAAELRERADAVERRLDAAGAIIDDRLDLLDRPDEPTVTDRVDDVDEAIATFGREVPARQLYEVAGYLPDAHDPAGDTALHEELGNLIDEIAAGETAIERVSDDVFVRTGGPDADDQTIDLEIDLDALILLDVSIRSLSPSEFFPERSRRLFTRPDGSFTVSFDASDLAPGTRFTVVARAWNRSVSLGTALERILRRVRGRDRLAALEALVDEGRLDEDERDAVASVFNRSWRDRFANLPPDQQVRAFELLDREDRLLVLEALGNDEFAEAYRTYGDLEGALETVLRDARTETRYELLRALDNEERIEDAELYAIERLFDRAGTDEFPELPEDDQIRAFGALDADDARYVIANLGPGRLAEIYRRHPTLDDALRAALEEVDPDERVRLLDELADRGRLDNEEREAIDRLRGRPDREEFLALSEDQQVDVFGHLDREDRLRVLEEIEREDAAEAFRTAGDLDDGLAAALRDVGGDRRRDALLTLFSEDRIDEGELRAARQFLSEVDASGFHELSPAEQVEVFLLFDPEDRIAALEALGRDDLAQLYRRHPTLDNALEAALLDAEPDTRFEFLVDEDRLDSDELDAIGWLVDPSWRVAFETLSEDEQLAVFADLDREDHLAALEALDRDRLAELYRQGRDLDDELGPAPAVATTGRVLPADGEDVGSLSDELESQTIVPRLLWLDRVVDEVRPAPTGGGQQEESPDTAGAILSDALDPRTIDWARIVDEEQLMTTVEGLSSPSAFDDDDLAAVRRLLDLRDLDLGALASSIDDAVEPLTEIGLTELVALTGRRDRPDALRYWRRRECDVGDTWNRHCEGSIRAQLRNFVRAPDWADLPTPYLRFAPELQRFVLSSGLQPIHVLAIDSVLRHPVRFVEALSGDVERPEVLLQDLHELLYHTRELVDHVDRDAFADRLDALGTRYQGSAPDDLGEYAELYLDDFASYLLSGGADELADAVVDDVPGMLTESESESLRQTHEDGVEASLVALHGAPDDPDPGSTRHAVDDRIAPALAAGDLAEPFRAGVLETLRRGLLRASYAGIYGSTPNSPAGGTPADETALLEQAEAVNESVDERLAGAGAAQNHGDEDAVATQVDRLEALLGDEFVVLPLFAPANAAELERTFGASDNLLDGDPYAVDTWLQRIARVRDRPAALRELLTYADLFDLAGDDATTATGGERSNVIRRSLTVGQLPHEASGDGDNDPSWIGLDGVTPDGGELSLASLFVTEHDPEADDTEAPVSGTAGASPMAGLLVDEWVETAPEPDRTISVGFRYDDPDLRAPQSIVLAVPPSWSTGTQVEGLAPTAPQTWSTELLTTTLRETIDLTRARSVDLDDLEGLGHLIPAVCPPLNEDTAEPQDQREVFLPDAPSVQLDDFLWLQQD